MTKDTLKYDYHVTGVELARRDKKSFRVDKYIHGGVHKDYYSVEIKLRDGGTREEDVWCTCMGFRRQKYSKLIHKHVKMAVEFWDSCVEHGFEPIGTVAIYKIGPSNEILFQRWVVTQEKTNG